MPCHWRGPLTGQATLEIIIALTILTVGLTSAALVIFGGQSLSLDSAENSKALRLAEQGLEEARTTARYDFSGLATSSSTENEFLKEVLVTSVNTSTKKIVSRVSWSTDPLRKQNIELTTLVTNWAGLDDTGGDTGGGGLIGDWLNPTTLGSVDLGPGNSATDLDVVNKIVYMTAEASAQSKPDFFVINATNGQSPYIVSNLDVGLGLNGIDVAGNYAYVASSDSNAQLQVIDITNGADPVLIKSYKLPEVSGSGAVGNSIFYSNSRIYIGTKNATGPEFHIIDVSNPLNPIDIGSFEVGGDVNEIHVNGDTVYIATSVNTGELEILDTSNLTSTTKIGYFDAPGGYDGKSVYLVGKKVYLGRQTGSGDEFRVIDVSDSSSPQSLGSANIGYDVNNVLVRDYLAFLNVADANQEFQVWNVSDPSSSTRISSFNFPQVANGIDYEDNLVYVAVRSNDALRVITSQ
mgnify:FL=1